MQIAIDGPSGAGKSTVAHCLAQHLGFIYIDTGAMYRACALKAYRSRLDLEDSSAVQTLLDQTSIEICHEQGEQVLYLDGQPVSAELRLPEISRLASDISKLPACRNKLLGLQRELAGRQNVVMDGRDIGSFVLPQADLKIFLTASAEERARRRQAQLQEQGITEDYEQILNELLYRDRQDSERKIAPLVQAPDAVLLDNSHLTQQEVIDRILLFLQQRGLLQDIGYNYHQKQKTERI
ncbi:(d)CMP kinase [Oscillospiraceae bacterium HV4-5-C5C]|nr:(d)CMP kinase [Oscillospiraceae bacterium HV4-5-C5C]